MFSPLIFKAVKKMPLPIALAKPYLIEARPHKKKRERELSSRFYTNITAEQTEAECLLRKSMFTSTCRAKWTLKKWELKNKTSIQKTVNKERYTQRTFSEGGSGVIFLFRANSNQILALFFYC